MRLDIPGAVVPNDEVYDQGIAWHYGDPLREQRFLAEPGCAVDISNRGVVSVTGPDRLTWLHDLTTQFMKELQPGQSCLALILDPHGHVEFELHCVDDGETTWIITQPGQAEPLVAYLDRMRFMLRVEVADRSADLAAVFLSGDAPDGLRAWEVPAEFAARGLRGCEIVATRAEATALITQAEHRAGSWALEALRVAALMPRVGRDTDDRTIPNEMGWLHNAVHLNKGCYRGQETVAKVHNLGRPPRKLVLLHGDDQGSSVLAHCATLHTDRQVGWVGTGAIHYELGTIALGIVKRNVEDGAHLRVDLGDATAQAVVESALPV
jgi:folate-binding protein YgfZ